jgi:hypothetical protein
VGSTTATGTALPRLQHVHQRIRERSYTYRGRRLSGRRVGSATTIDSGRMCPRNPGVTPATVYICPKNTEPRALAWFYPRRSCIARVASCMSLAVLDRRATGVATSVGLGSPVALFLSLQGPASRPSSLSTPPHLTSLLLTSPCLGGRAKKHDFSAVVPTQPPP